MIRKKKEYNQQVPDPCNEETNDKKREKKKKKHRADSQLVTKTKKNGQGKKNQKRKKETRASKKKTGTAQVYIGGGPEEARLCFLPGGEVLIAGLGWWFFWRRGVDKNV